MTLTLQPAAACRLWCAVGDNVDAAAITQGLLEGPLALKRLGESNPDGWGLVYFAGGESVTRRGFLPVTQDSGFDDAVVKMIREKPAVMIAHIRAASAGCRGGVPDPHPFERRMGEKTWHFAHNGDVNKLLLIELIGAAYLASHPPLACVNNPPGSWVDSELYFLLLLQHIERANGDAAEGLGNALRMLESRIPEDSQRLNFLLSDGHRTWAFRKGAGLQYRYLPQKQQTFIASTVPVADKTGWEEVPDDTLVEIRAGSAPRFVPLD